MRAMIKLIKNADVYAPEHLGRRDILICGEKIAAVEEHIDITATGGAVEVVDLNGAALGPGYMDGHVHITGGGGEQGPASRVPESRVSEIVSCGVTTVLAMLGTDCISRSLENVLAKARALTEDGISAYMLTGSYRIPSPTMTGSVMRDLVLIDKVIGTKVALSDHRGPAATAEELARLFSEARVGGLVGGKAGLAVVHMGAGAAGVTPLLQAAEMSDTNLNKILPTHCGRNERTFGDAIFYSQQGGNFDLTADSPADAAKSGGAARLVSKALEQGVDIEKITISSDGYGSQPRFNEKMECIGMTYSRCNTVHDELCRMVQQERIPLETALRPVTSNVAARMGLTGVKGVVAPGADADLVVWDNAMGIARVYARGRLACLNGQPVLKGRFE